MLKIAKDLFDLLYPIGTYYETSNANWTPSNAGWYGTWVEDSAGMVMVALDSTQTEFNTINKTGGSKYLQSHNHQIWNAAGSLVRLNYGGGGSTYKIGLTYNWDKIADTGNEINTTNVNNLTTGNSGNLQPYKVARRWHRIA